MNEFTKEELQYILDELKATNVRQINSWLIDKIVPMIDNYCEHEWENICCQCTLDKIYCHKCEKDMGDLNESSI